MKKKQHLHKVFKDRLYMKDDFNLYKKIKSKIKINKNFLMKKNIKNIKSNDVLTVNKLYNYIMNKEKKR